SDTNAMARSSMGGNNHERQLVVTDYFPNEDSFGKVHAEGDHKVHVARVERNNLELDPTIRIEFRYGVRHRTGTSSRCGDQIDDFVRNEEGSCASSGYSRY